MLNRFALALPVTLMLVACASAPSGKRAPIVEYGSESSRPAPSPAADKKMSAPERVTIRPIDSGAEQVYVVQKGDTLYSIAFLHGVDYREVAQLNGLTNPAEIKVGQQLRLWVPAVVAEPKPVESRSVSALQNTPPGGIKSQPKVGKIPYSAQAMAQADKYQEDKSVSAVPVQAPVQVSRPAADAGDEPLEWGMPSSGKVIAGYSENANRKGVDIAGQKGQAVLASASGKVVYSGSGLRGYGKLIIIKHNKTYLSAYAHNDNLLVKEGQNVTKGQKIAEMGSSDTDQVKLHFEIRKFGKPVDPALYLPLIKS